MEEFESIEAAINLENADISSIAPDSLRCSPISKPREILKNKNVWNS